MGRRCGLLKAQLAFRILLVLMVCFIATGCPLFQRGTVNVTNAGHAEVLCEFQWGPENKSLNVGVGSTETTSLAAGSYTFYVTEAAGGNFVESLYFILDANTEQSITIPNW